MEFHIGSQVPKVPPKIAISHIKPEKFLFLFFLVEPQLYFTIFLKIYVTVLLLKKYLNIEKKHVFFYDFVKPLIFALKLEVH